MKTKKEEPGGVNIDTLVEEQLVAQKWCLEKHDTKWFTRSADTHEHTRR